MRLSKRSVEKMNTEKFKKRLVASMETLYFGSTCPRLRKLKKAHKFGGVANQDDKIEQKLALEKLYLTIAFTMWNLAMINKAGEFREEIFNEFIKQISMREQEFELPNQKKIHHVANSYFISVTQDNEQPEEMSRVEIMFSQRLFNITPDIDDIDERYRLRTELSAYFQELQSDFVHEVKQSRGFSIW